MIEYEKFKKILYIIPGEPEIRIYFENKSYEYMIIKYDNYVSFQRCGIKDGSGEIKFTNLDELYNTTTIDNIFLKEDWSKIKDIILNETFSFIYDLDDIESIYHI